MLQLGIVLHLTLQCSSYSWRHRVNKLETTCLPWQHGRKIHKAMLNKGTFCPFLGQHSRQSLSTFLTEILFHYSGQAIPWSKLAMYVQLWNSRAFQILLTHCSILSMNRDVTVLWEWARNNLAETCDHHSSGLCFNCSILTRIQMPFTGLHSTFAQACSMVQNGNYRRLIYPIPIASLFPL